MKEREKTITVEAIVGLPIAKVWELWTSPKHIVHWNFASDDWCTPTAKNDLKNNGKFLYRMEAKDGSFGFDFSGVYENIKPQELIVYKMDDGRMASITFSTINDKTKIIETFEAETENPIELQKNGWQAILNNFKKYAEAYQKQNLSLHSVC